MRFVTVLAFVEIKEHPKVASRWLQPPNSFTFSLGWNYCDRFS